MSKCFLKSLKLFFKSTNSNNITRYIEYETFLFGKVYYLSECDGDGFLAKMKLNAP